MEGINRLFKVLFSPTEVFEDAKKAPKLLLPIIFLTLVVTGAQSYYAYQMNAPVVLEKQLEMSKWTRQLSDEQKDKIIEQQSKTVKYTAPIGALIATPIMLLLIALYFFVVAKIMGSDAGYGQNLAVIVYASAPAIVAMLVAMAIMLTGNTSTTLFKDLAPSNLGYFFPMEAVGKKLNILFRSIDFFSIWEYILMIIGFSIVTGTKKWKSAAVILVPLILFISVIVLIF
ncbi:MAG: YIP1 family protein [Acidobacteria bacterium]|nr:YIP1 family protein [Acidobacteriota bacterium]